MKEFEKKNPNREPASEGMKGLSKFLPMTDSNYRRRLTEYEVQVQDLQAYVRSLEAETGRLRKKMEEAPREFMVLENKLREANRQLVQAFNQNEKLVNALYEAREQITSLKEEVDKLCAPPSTYGVYLAANEDGTVTILSQGRKVKVNLHPVDQGRGDPARAGADPQRRAERRRDGGVRDPGRGGDPQGAAGRRAGDRHAAGGRGPGGHDRRALAAGEAEGRRSPAAGRQERVPAGEAAQGRGGGSGAGGSAGHRLRGHRRADDADRVDQGRRGAAVPVQRLLQGAPPGAAQGRAALRAAGLRQDDDRQGGGQQPGRADLGEARGEGQGLLPEHQGAGAAQQVRGRDGAQDPRDLRQGAGEGGRGRAGGDLLRRDGRAVPHARVGDLLRRRDHDRAAAPGGAGRGGGAQERDRDRGLEPAGPDRPGDPAAGAAGREDQDRAAGPGAAAQTSSTST